MEKFSLYLPVLVLAVHFLPAVAMTTPVANLTTDQSALLAFKSRMGPDDVLMHNWSADAATSCCSWIGVSCGVRHLRVVALNLSFMGLTGTLPPHLGNLSFLASLDLRNNSFNGHLPNELGFLRRLKVIDLDFNYFTGELPLWFGNLTQLQLLYLQANKFYGKIAPGIFKCTQLQVLSLSINKLTGNLPREIGNLTMLEELWLGDNNFEGVIPEEMGNLVALETLNIQFTNLRGPIPLPIFNLSSLKTLVLSQNNLSGSLPKDVCSHFSNLEILHLSYNQLTGPIPTGSWGCSELIMLELDNNRFTGSLPRGIGNLTMIEEIYLDYNNLKGVIPMEMDNLINLEVLSIAINGLTGPIPHAIFNISTLRVIALSNNNLSGQLPSTFGLWLPNLKGLYLSSNELGGAIPYSVSNSSNLIVIDLLQNSFTGSVPNTLGDLGLLEVLNVGLNFLTTELRFLTFLTNCKYLRSVAFFGNPMGGVLPISIGNMSVSLERFYAHDCKIRGRIPREIGNMSNLIHLSLYSNHFTGSLPSTFGRLQKIQEFYVDNNRLQGPISYDICHLKWLGDLRLGGNQLSGPIPSCVNNLTSIRYLYLDSNKLHSIIPSTLWSLTNILELNLSGNSLRGYLPVDVGNLKTVRLLHFSRNQLSGDIPSSIGGLQKLVSLYLDHNRLHGSIPQSFGNMISLEFMDISNNILSGVIPKTLEALSHLNYLNLSSNKLEGEIPNGGPFVNFSALSFMMNRDLCGETRLQVPPCTSDTPQRPKKFVPLLKYILPAVASAVLLVVIILVLLRHGKKHVKSPSQEDLSPIAWRRISYHQLVQATNGFCESNLLGMGSFGSVYRGMLSDGVNVAVKVFNLQLEGAFKSFETECEVLRNIRHRNLIKVISSCANIDFKCLVLECMPNGSLEKWLYSFNYSLDILQRLNIIIDVATALEYLHHGHSTLVVHSDLKPSNVLLDEDMVAKVGDFGIARLLGEETVAHTKTFGTIGYMAPEYGLEGAVSSRSDVYSFGILVMETFTRKKPVNEMFVGEMTLKHWVKESVPHALTTVADANLLRREEEYFDVKKECISSILKVALACSMDIPEERMDIKDVLGMLNEIRTKLQRVLHRLD